MPPVEQAREIFTRLGYVVSGEGTELTAERKWRTVHVTAMTGTDAETECIRTDGGDGEPRLRCFVTWDGYAGELRERLLDVKPPYDWAVIEVDSHGGYEVLDNATVPA
jgi:hypothetical protein